ncbi:MAG TPA: pyrimidine reductase family protein [Jatrophihabitans sp.]|jgi:riboflavin biosynthesis pyrimidine reductase
MRSLIPDATGSVDLHAFYAAGWSEPGGLRMNFVSSVDGAATAEGLSKGLQTPGDNTVFATLRDLGDVILVGAGTVRAENYRPSRPSAARQEIRLAHGYQAVPPIAVVTRSLDLDPTSELFADAAPAARTVVLTVASAPDEARATLDAVADVVICGEDVVDLRVAVAALRERGHRRILSEGGPHLFSEFAAAGLVDELCLSISPLLSGPGGPRISQGLPWQGDPLPLTLTGLLEEDGGLFCRYRVGVASE